MQSIFRFRVIAMRSKGTELNTLPLWKIRLIALQTESNWVNLIARTIFRNAFTSSQLYLDCKNMWFYSWSQEEMLLLFYLIFMTESRKILRTFSKWATVSTSLFATIASLKTGFLICIYLLLIQLLFSLAIHRSRSKLEGQILSTRY